MLDLVPTISSVGLHWSRTHTARGTCLKLAGVGAACGLHPDLARAGAMCGMVPDWLAHVLWALDLA